eukprot:jgi/Tetstr1/460706/TSEL_005893.t1
MSLYREARAKCSWTSVPAPDYKLSRLRQNGRADRPPGPASKLVFEACHVRDDNMVSRSALESNFWEITRAGPFKSSPGDRHDFGANGFIDLSKRLGGGLPIWITGSTLQLLGADGAPLGSPPLHNHHTQMFFPDKWGIKAPIRQARTQAEYELFPWNLVFQSSWAGDTQCKEAEGGVDCLIFSLPAGFGQKLHSENSSLPLRQMILDVREDGLEDMEFYVEVGERWTRKPQTSLMHYNVLSPGNGLFHTYPISEQSTAMNFGASLAPRSGRVMYVWPHGHWEFVDSLMVFAASPEQLGLAGGSGPLDFSNLGAHYAVELEKVGYSIEEAQAYLLENLARSQRLCRFHGNCTSEPQLMCAFMDKHREPPVKGEQGLRLGPEWDRQAHHSTDCESIFVNKGDMITQVMFHPRAQDGGVNIQHNLFLFYFLDSDEEIVEGTP